MYHIFSAIPLIDVETLESEAQDPIVAIEENLDTLSENICTSVAPIHQWLRKL